MTPSFNFDSFFSWRRLLVAGVVLFGAFGGMRSKGTVISGLPPSGPPRDIRVDATGNLTLGGGTAAIGTVNAQGTQASGDTIAASNFPMLAAGRDQSGGGNVLRPIAVSSSGAVAITASGVSLPVTGTLTVDSARVQGMEAEGATITSDPVLIAGRDRSAGGDALRGIAVSSDGAVAITDSGDSITVDSVSNDSFPTNATLQIADVDAPGGAGVVTASTPRFTQATDDAAAVALADDSIELEAGTATIGSIGAIVSELPAGTQNIGDVDVVSLPALVAGTATVGSVQVINAQADPVQVEIGDGTETALVTAAGELNVIATAQPGVDLGDVTLTEGTATVGSMQVINALTNPVNARLGDGTDQTLVTAAGELNVLATAQPGVDIGDVTLTASTATVGSIGAIVNALPAGGNTIGDVTVSSLPALVAGTATVGSVQVINALANPVNARLGDGTDQALVTAAGELNVIATAQPGVNIGDVTLTASTATIGTIGAIVSELPAGTQNIGDVDVVSLPALVAGTATVGSIGSIVNELPAGTQNIGDVDVASLPGSLTGFAEDAAHITGDTGLQLLVVHSDVAQTLAGTDGDYAPPVATRLGDLRCAIAPEHYIDSLGAYYLIQTAFTTVTTAGAEEIQPVAAQGAGNSIVLVDWIIATDTNVNVQFESDDSDAGITARAYLGANGGWTSDHSAAWGETADNQALKLQVSAAATVSVQVRYFVR